MNSMSNTVSKMKRAFSYTVDEIQLNVLKTAKMFLMSVPRACSTQNKHFQDENKKNRSTVWSYHGFTAETIEADAAHAAHA